VAEREAENGTGTRSTMLARGSARPGDGEPTDVAREGVVSAFVLGWHLAELFHVDLSHSVRSQPVSVNRLPGISEFDPLSWAKLLLAQVQADLHRVWRLDDAGGPPPDPRPIRSLLEAETRQQSQLQQVVLHLHQQLLVALTAADSRLGKAYTLGKALAETALLPTARDPTSFQRAFGRYRVANLLDWLLDLESAFPPHAAEAVRGSLEAWVAWTEAPTLRPTNDDRRRPSDAEVDGQASQRTEVDPGSPTASNAQVRGAVLSRFWRIRQSPKPQTRAVDWKLLRDRERVTRALYRQGQVWRAILSGETAVGNQPEQPTSTIPSAALWAVVVLAVVLGSVLVFALWRTGLAAGRSSPARWAVWVLALVGFAVLGGAIRAAVRVVTEASIPASLAAREIQTRRLHWPIPLAGQRRWRLAFDEYLQSSNLAELEGTPGDTDSRFVSTPALLAIRKQVITHAWFGAAGMRAAAGMATVVLVILILAPRPSAARGGGADGSSSSSTSTSQPPSTTTARGQPASLPSGIVAGVAAGVAPALAAELVQPLVQVAAAAASTPADVKKLVLEDVAGPLLRAGSTKLGDALGGALARSAKLTPSQPATGPSKEAVAQVQLVLQQQLEHVLRSSPELASAAAKVGQSPNQFAHELAVTLSQDLANDIADGLMEIPSSANLDQPIVAAIARGVVEQRADQAKQHSPPSTAPAPTAPPPTSGTPPLGGRSYVVRSGDSLWQIARRLLGPHATSFEIDRAWRTIYRANRASIGPDPNRIVPGQVLIVPSGLRARARQALPLSWLVLPIGATAEFARRGRYRRQGQVSRR
jgi:nucleoid-associated protein YgaU